jgi:DNA-binding NarL/FixJ family response regulator
MIPSMTEKGPVAAALLGTDLILASRLEGALSSAGISLARGTGAGLPPPAAAVFVDLNQEVDTRVDAIARLRKRDPGALIVAFCDHDRSEVMRRAMAAGADRVIANRHLPEAALRLVVPARSGTSS